MSSTSMGDPILDDANLIRDRFGKELARQANLSFRTNRLGLSIPEAVGESSEFNSNVRIPELEKNIVFFDEAISIYISLNFVLLAILKQMEDEKPEPSLAFVRSCCVVTFRIISDALAIRVLIQNGFDVQAKALLRSLDECCEFFSAILIQPELANEFFDSQELEKSREFWHKNINKGRLRTLIDRHVSELGDFGAEQMQMASYRLEERLVTMTAKHVSYISGYMAFAGNESDEDQFGLLGRKSNNSIRTVRYALSVLIEPLVLSPGFPFDLIKDDYSAWSMDELKEMVAHVKHGVTVMVQMISEFKIFGDENV